MHPSNQYRYHRTIIRTRTAMRRRTRTRRGWKPRVPGPPSKAQGLLSKTRARTHPNPTTPPLPQLPLLLGVLVGVVPPHRVVLSPTTGVVFSLYEASIAPPKKLWRGSRPLWWCLIYPPTHPRWRWGRIDTHTYSGITITHPTMTYTLSIYRLLINMLSMPPNSALHPTNTTPC